MELSKSPAPWIFAAGFVAGFATLPWIGCQQDTGVQPNGGTAQGFPYKPEGCSYQVDIPEVTASGFDDGKLGSAPTPVHVHVSWAGPTSSTFAVNWKTDNDTTATQLLYGTVEADVKSADAAAGTVKRATGHHMLYSDATPTRVHEAHVCGLDPAKKYFYKVGAKGAWSGVYPIATGPAAGAKDKFRFAVAGDARGNAMAWAKTQELVSQQGVDFEVFSGDAVDIGTTQGQWDAFFEGKSGTFAVQDLLAKTPMMVTNGNHDLLSVNYIAQFAMPQDKAAGESAQGEEWYSFDFGNAHFVALNDTVLNDSTMNDEKTWLDADLGKVDRQKTPWIFVVNHQPMYSCGDKHGSALDVRKAWQPVIDGRKVDVVFAGHEHTYERSKPIRDDGVIAQSGMDGAPVSESGTVYVVSAGAGAELYGVKTSCTHTYKGESTLNFVVVDVSDRTLKLTAYRPDGTTIDQFTYTK